MYTLDGRSRKRSFRDLPSLPFDDEKQRRKTVENAVFGKPVICLTGLTTDEKDKYHGIIMDLGGRYTRNLDSSVNTHLIARVPEGLKYEAAVSIPSLRIVKPTWLDACASKKKWISTKEFLLGASKDSTTQVVKENIAMEQLLPELNKQLLVDRPDSEIFLDCQVFLVGFDDQREVKIKLSRLLRRGMATIYWDLNDEITHVIIADGLEDQVRDAARLLVEQHQNFPSIVSPRWIVASWEKNKLEDLDRFQPMYIRKPVKAVEAHIRSTTCSEVSTLLFRGSLFAFLRISPPDNVVDYDRDELEQLAVTHGGQTLSREIVDALRMDKARGIAPRQCYVICWGSYQESSLFMNSLLSQMIKENLGEVIQVTPVWMQTCVAEQKLISPSRYKEIFAPSTFPLRKLLHFNTKKLKEDAVVRVCATGYSGYRRKAIKLFLESMGADYDDSLRPCTTHLICREASGSKYEKATEWNVHTVSIDWLYHVARFGYCGNTGGNKGCEAEFSIQKALTKK